MTTIAPIAPGQVASYDRDGIMGLLPHRDPMLLLDRIVWLEPGERATAVASDLASRAPGIPRTDGEAIPRELLVEGLAQTAAAVIVADGVAHGRTPPGEPQPGVLAAVPEFRFVAPVPEGAEVVFRVALVRKVGRLIIMSGEVTAGAVTVALGTLAIALGKPGA